ncbi:hypothetical protein E4U21_000839 [Claviceps maximensis]|nr:hypothetical protein E4U21_000839 [Claviceps maximensis]
MARGELTHCYFCGQVTSPTIPQTECLGCASNEQSPDWARQQRASSTVKFGAIVNGNLIIVTYKPHQQILGEALPIPIPIPRPTRREY